MNTRKLALIVAIAGIVILIFGLITPTTSDSSSGGMNGGSGEDKISYSISNAALILVGSFVTAIGLSFWAFKEDYVPVPVERSVPIIIENEKNEGRSETSKEPEPSTKEDESPITGENLVILRLLSGDERHMFRTIVDLGGEALQKDLIVRTKMSDAKVSRVIDRLIEKGLVTKERFGVTNKIRISIEK